MQRRLRVSLVGLLASCGGGAMYASQPPPDQTVPTASGPPPPLNDDPHTQVDRLHADLVAHRTALGLRTPPRPADDACEPVCSIEDPAAAPTKTHGCVPAAGSACAGVCAQADAACDDAAQICAIAKQLSTEAWASSACHDASATCTDAHAPCCSCELR